MPRNSALLIQLFSLFFADVVSAQPLTCEVQRVVKDCSPLSSNMDCMAMGILSESIGTMNGVKISSRIEKCDTAAIFITGGVCFEVRYELKNAEGKTFQLGARFICQ